MPTPPLKEDPWAPGRGVGVGGWVWWGMGGGEGKASSTPPPGDAPLKAAVGSPFPYTSLPLAHLPSEIYEFRAGLQELGIFMLL